MVCVCLVLLLLLMLLLIACAGGNVVSALGMEPPTGGAPCWVARIRARLPHGYRALQRISMRDAGILDGDLIAVHRTPEARNGQIVVARLGDDPHRGAGSRSHLGRRR